MLFVNRHHSRRYFTLQAVKETQIGLQSVEYYREYPTLCNQLLQTHAEKTRSYLRRAQSS